MYACMHVCMYACMHVCMYFSAPPIMYIIALHEQSRPAQMHLRLQRWPAPPPLPSVLLRASRCNHI